MAFVKKTWKDRMVEFAGRRTITNVSTQEAMTVDVTRSEGEVSQVGDAFSADNMNDLETRIEEAFQEVSAKSPFSFGVDSEGNYGYIKEGADTVIPFRSLSGLKCWNSGTLTMSPQQSTSSTFSKPAGVTELIIIYMISSSNSSPAISYTKNCIKNEKSIFGWSHGQSGYYVAGLYGISAQTISDAGDIAFTIKSIVPSGGTSMSQCNIAVLY